MQTEPISLGIANAGVVIGNNENGGIINIVNSPRRVPLCATHTIRSLKAFFTGREEELLDLEARLSSSQAAGSPTAAKHIGIHGMPGVGKTELALALAHRLKDRYPDAQIFLELRGADPEHRSPITPVEIIQSVIRALRPDAEILPDTLDKLAPLYLSVLSCAGRVLLLLDDAAGPDQVGPLLVPAGCALIVTSRQQIHLEELETHETKCLPSTKSNELLLKRAPCLAGYEEEAAILCGHLPLALNVVADTAKAESRLRTKAESLLMVRKLLDRLRAGQEKLERVEAVFQVSYEILTEELQRSWRLLAVFPSSFDIPAAAAVVGNFNFSRHGSSEGGLPNETASARDAMQALVNVSLLEWNETDGRFHLHGLVREFLIKKLSIKERADVNLKHAQHYLSVGQSAEALYKVWGLEAKEGLALFDLERHNIEAAFYHLASLPEASGQGKPKDVAAEQGDELPEGTMQQRAELLVVLVNSVLSLITARFNPDLRSKWHGTELKAARIARNMGREATALNHLAQVCLDRGSPADAVPLCEEAVGLLEATSDLELRCRVLILLTKAHLRTGDGEGTKRAFTLAEGVHEDLRNQDSAAVNRVTGSMLHTRALVEMACGHQDDALLTLGRALNFTMIPEPNQSLMLY